MRIEATISIDIPEGYEYFSTWIQYRRMDGFVNESCRDC